MPTAAGPLIIQGGMGVAVSGWELARAVSRTGQLGVVSGTALEIVCTRRLQLGDPGGHVRRALAAFPSAQIASWIIEAYFIEGGKPASAPFAAVPRWTLQPGRRLQELTVAANFVEVYLAKEGHGGLVGINYLRKIELPLPFACYGALLAGADYVLMGAGNPADLPALLRSLARHEPTAWAVRVQGATSADPDRSVVIAPRDLIPGASPEPLPLPRVLAIVASLDLAAGLAADPACAPDGFVVEGPSAGGHNAPPRGPRRLDDLGQPVYDVRDRVDVGAVVDLGLPVWLAGSYGSPAGLADARAAGAAGVQLGTAFAFCRESGMAPAIKAQVLARARAGSLTSRSDWRASPTGFPFRVLELDGTLSEPAVVAGRGRVCDLGVLRSPVQGDGGEVSYRCPAEPTQAYVRRGGRVQNTDGRLCLCNALLSSAGLPQSRPRGYVEPALVTAGSDFGTVAVLQRSADGDGYTAADVVRHVLGEAARR